MHHLRDVLCPYRRRHNTKEGTEPIASRTPVCRRWLLCLKCSEHGGVVA